MLRALSHSRHGPPLASASDSPIANRSALVQSPKRLLESVPTLATHPDLDEEALGEDDADWWSPRKKKNRYVIGLTQAPPSKSNDGLVILSLHEHPSSTAHAVAPPTLVRRKGQSTNCDVAPEEPPRSIYIPLSPHDFRFVETGTIVWLWEPIQQAVLRLSGDVDRSPMESRNQRSPRRADAAAAESALIASRFAFLL
ncbi:hypothetical protein OIO90_004413 [Microbotryomycetes sp. JL221]|nr:hypothetical protein OIO90_004413 [Microbotryomycetes sp. JL221]